MSKELKTTAEVAETQEKDKKEQAEFEKLTVREHVQAAEQLHKILPECYLNAIIQSLHYSNRFCKQQAAEFRKFASLQNSYEAEFLADVERYERFEGISDELLSLFVIALRGGID